MTIAAHAKPVPATPPSPPQHFLGEVFLHEGKLFVSMPGQGEAELFAKSPTEFMVRVDPTAAIRFEGAKVFVTIQGRELIGVRQP